MPLNMTWTKVQSVTNTLRHASGHDHCIPAAAMTTLTILRTYAQKSPTELPSSILFSHTPTSFTIYDAFPKSIFHFLVLPRIIEPYCSSGVPGDLNNLRSLLRSDKERAKALITSLRDDAKIVAKEIEGEMMKRYGFKWEVWTGFHSTPSLE